MSKKIINKFNIFYLMILSLLFFLAGFMFIPKKISYSETWISIANDTSFLNTGDGSQNNPYKISTAYQLASLSKLFSNTETYPTYASKNYVLTDNINLSSYEWVPIGSSSNTFKGVFDGGGNTILGINIETSSNVSYAGLFAKTYNATIKNLIISGINNSSNIVANTNSTELNVNYAYAGGVVGYAQNTTFDNISNLGVNVYSFSKTLCSFAGGIVGYALSSNFNYVINYANVNSYNALIKSSYTKPGIVNNNSTSYAGGIAGSTSGNSNITYARNNGEIKALNNKTSNDVYCKSYAGGIIGSNSNFVSLSFNSGKVISGSSQSYISYKNTTYQVTLPKQSYAGGIAGFSSNTIDNAFNTGEITAVAETFINSTTEVLPYTFPNSEWHLCTGNFGANSDEVLCTGQTNCNTYDYLQLKDVGSVSLKTMYAYAGGIAGSSTNSISNSYNDGTINGGKIEKTIALSIKYYVRYRYNNWGWKTVSKNLYYYISISYYDTLFYGAINGDRSISTENTYGSSTLINYYKKIDVNCYEYNDSQTNNITVTKTYSAESDSAQALLLTPSGHNSISLEVKGTTTMKYFDAITFRFNISRNDNNVIINFGSEWKHNCPGEPEDMCVINPSNYTIMENNYVNQNINHSITTSTNLLPNMLGSFWEKVNGVNGNRPYIKNFYWE